MDWAVQAGPVVMLVRNPAAEAVAEALRAGVKAVLSSGRSGPEIVAAIEAAAAGLGGPRLDRHGNATARSERGFARRFRSPWSKR